MAKKIKLAVGDVFRVRMQNGLYIFGHIVFFVPRKNQEKYQKLNSESYLKGFFSNCVLVDIYAQISENQTLENTDVFFKGIFLSSSDLSTMGEDIAIEDNIPVTFNKVEFPEIIGASSEDGFFLERGELVLKLGNVQESKREELMKFPSSFKDIYSVADAVLFCQNRKSEMQRNYYEGWKHNPSDLKYNPELRKQVYTMIGEDPNQNYYELALKHGFDLARFY